MPNYCMNKIELSGKNQDIKNLLDFVGSEESVFDFNKIIPIPPSIKDTERGSVAFASEAVCWYLKEKKITSHLKWLLDRYNITEEELPGKIQAWQQENKVKLELGYRIIENRKLYQGYGDWYEWCIANWGTKWEACDPEVRENTIVFETAWSPATPIVEKLAKMFPQLNFLYKYFEPGVNLAGINNYAQGNCLSCTSYDYNEEAYIKLGNEFGFEFTKES